ncbi:type II toxin-antitoxin system VapC family toxin [Dyadobacter sp. CY343]|uniref:type II toxin-antitoxin system VapC family toxin n=1 Tax=Dyadobacter sp. CY343 TaxID=2907299 RepID=UPI001F3A4F86|nr:type II toxin-antitoxin system VapC family toxin [Dyadobacter sp. CY343]MCE7062594.1 type II toxin-antitoxin system VapC family toxin [Dyadobacter sp. CY343]
MNYILDTHTLIWFMEGDKQLSNPVLTIMEDTTKLKYVSIASIWEIGIKISLQKLNLNKSFKEFLSDLSRTNIAILPLGFSHIIRISEMEHIHRDPFDRIIIAQAQEEAYIILGRDPQFIPYNVKMVWN